MSEEDRWTNEVKEGGALSQPDAAYEGAPESWVDGPVTFTLEHEEYFSRWIGRLAAVRKNGVVLAFDDPSHPLGDPVFIPWGSLQTLSPEKAQGER